MELALRQVREGMSQKRAAKLYGVPRTTLNDKIRGVAPEVGKSGPATVLNTNEETLLANHIKNMAMAGLPMTRKDLLTEVKRLLDEDERVTKFKDNMPGTNLIIECQFLVHANN